jgi:hypothetical protein
LAFAGWFLIETVLGLGLTPALIGELSPAEALNRAVREAKSNFEKSGRKTLVDVALAEWRIRGTSITGNRRPLSTPSGRSRQQIAPPHSGRSALPITSHHPRVRDRCRVHLSAAPRSPAL